MSKARRIHYTQERKSMLSPLRVVTACGRYTHINETTSALYKVSCKHCRSTAAFEMDRVIKKQSTTPKESTPS